MSEETRKIDSSELETETKEELSAGDMNVENKEKEDAPEKTETEEEGKKEEFVDILGNGTLLKRIHAPGTGINPQMGEKVSIRLFKAIPEHGKEFAEQEVTFILGDCDVEQALDLGVSLMKLGEKATFIAGFKYMYGEQGLEPDIPPAANFKLDVHLTTNHGFPDYSKMDLEERFMEAKKKKERGNFYFRRMEYTQAVYVYTKANKIVDPEEGCVYPDAAPKLLQELLEFRGIILANTSVAQLKIGAADAAIKSAIESTNLCPAYSKAYFRLGQAYEGKGQIDEAIKAHKTALKNDPENSKEKEFNQVIHNELSRLTKLNKEAKKSEREMYSKMFWGSKPPNVANSQSANVKDTSSSKGPAPSSSAKTPSDTFNPDFLFNNPMFEAGIQAGKQSLASGQSFEDTMAMASQFLQQMPAGQMNDPEFLMKMAGQMSAIIPPEVDAMLRKNAENRFKSLTEEELAKAQEELLTALPGSLEELRNAGTAASTDGMNDQLTAAAAMDERHTSTPEIAPTKQEPFPHGTDLNDTTTIADAAEATKNGSSQDVNLAALEKAAEITKNGSSQDVNLAALEKAAEITKNGSSQDDNLAALEKAAETTKNGSNQDVHLAALEKAAEITKNGSSQDVNLAALEKAAEITKNGSSQNDNLAALEKAAEITKNGSSQDDNLAALEKAAEITKNGSSQDANLSALEKAAEARKKDGTSQRVDLANVEITQMYAKLRHFSWSTDVDSGNVYGEEPFTLDHSPPKDIVEVRNEEAKYSWLKNPLLLGTIGAGLAGAVSLGVYRYLNTH